MPTCWHSSSRAPWVISARWSPSTGASPWTSTTSGSSRPGSRCASPSPSTSAWTFTTGRPRRAVTRRPATPRSGHADVAEPVTRRGSRRQTHAVCALAAFIAFLDVTIVHVAFPDMERYFSSVGSAGLSWVLNGYNVVFAALLVPAGRFADLLGRRRVFLGGLIAFTLASIGCALAPTVWALVALRVLQAIGAAAVIPTSIALLLEEYPVQRRLTATAVLGACAAAAAAFGPIIGGLLIELMDWRLVFLVNLPLGVVALAWGARTLRESADPARGAVPDLLGALFL